MAARTPRKANASRTGRPDPARRAPSAREMRERAPQRPAASAPRRAPTTPSRRGGTNAGKVAADSFFRATAAQFPFLQHARRLDEGGAALESRRSRAPSARRGRRRAAVLARPGRQGARDVAPRARGSRGGSRIALAVVVVCAALLVFGVADFAVNANKAYPGVRVGQIDAAGKTADELAALIDEVYGARLAQGSVTIYANDEAEARIADETAAAPDAALAEQLALEEARAHKLAWTADAASLEAFLPMSWPPRRSPWVARTAASWRVSLRWRRAAS
ncbi:MAG: hypothetical protein ACLR3C_04650 [Eggerthella lenta]